MRIAISVPYRDDECFYRNIRVDGISRGRVMVVPEPDKVQSNYRGSIVNNKRDIIKISASNIDDLKSRIMEIMSDE
jgi:hypothetical protein